MLRAVLFDYGLTLVTFRYPRDELLSVLEQARPWLGPAAPDPETLMRTVLEPLKLRTHARLPDSLFRPRSPNSPLQSPHLCRCGPSFPNKNNRCMSVRPCPTQIHAKLVLLPLFSVNPEADFSSATPLPTVSPEP